MTLADTIRNAPNVNAINRLLNDDEVIVNSGKGLWTFTVGGNTQGFAERFVDVRSRVAKWVESTRP